MAFGFTTLSNAAKAEIERNKAAAKQEEQQAREKAQEQIKAIEAQLEALVENLKTQQKNNKDAVKQKDFARQEAELETYRTAIAAHKATLEEQVKTIRGETQQAKAERIASFQAAGLKRYPGVFSRAGELFASLKSAVASYRKDSGFLSTYKAATVESVNRDTAASEAKSVAALSTVKDKLPDLGDDVATAVFAAYVDKKFVTEVTKDIKQEYKTQRKAAIATEKADIAAEQAKVGAEFRDALGTVANDTGSALAGTGSNIVDALAIAPGTTVVRAVKTVVDLAAIETEGSNKITEARAVAAASKPARPSKEPTFKAPENNAA